MREAAVPGLARKHEITRQFGVLGESRVNILQLNLDLNNVHSMR
jgi:K+-transporting ATPase c subunit